MNKDPFFKKIDQQKEVDKTVEQFMGAGAFTSRKVTDTPKDDLQVVNRKYVNMSGTSANRPSSPVVGQQYFDTTINKPAFYDGTNWRDAASSII